MTTIGDHAALLAEYEALTGVLLDRDDVEQAACAAQTGAAIFAMNHPGGFASARLDAALVAAAEALGPAPRWSGNDADPRRVLHVLSHADAQGGHTRLALRWMGRDTGRRHSVVVTSPTSETPRPVLDAVAASGGREHTVFNPAGDLFDGTNGLLERARRLRALAFDHDAVVLYLDPHDPLPAIALGALRERPPVLGCDVTDHTFGIGRAAVDLHVAPREQAVNTAVQRRGIPADRVAMLPLPVTSAADDAVRAQTRATLGLADDDVLLLTVAAAYKFETTDGPHLLDLVEPVLAAHPHVRLVAAGPTLEGRWAQSHARTGGRVTALGVVESAGLVAAADVVLESYPCSGGTFSLEAAAAGLPLLGFAPDPDEAAMLSTQTMACDGWPYPATPARYRRALELLVTDGAVRAAAGQRAHEATRISHDAGAWRAACSELYARAAQLGPLDPEDLGTPTRVAGRDSEVTHALHVSGGKLIDPAKAATVTARVRLIAADPSLAALFVHVTGGFPVPPRRYGQAVAAPAPQPVALREAVARLRDAAIGGLAERSVLVLAPEEVETAVPVIEAALGHGDDFELQLTPAADPCAVLDFDSLPLPVPGDRLAQRGVALA